VVAVAGGSVQSENPIEEPSAKAPRKMQTVPVAAPLSRQASAPIAGQVTNSANMAAMDAAVGTSLDALKDTLFRLELRRQAGTISEEEYNQERARAEKVLRDLVRG
jgi:hypothetical protein